MSLTVTDFFCGMGGSSTGLTEAGFEVKLAANHWYRAIETHSANHPTTEHLCADLQAVDLRYLPHTRILWASPICTEVSPAGGRRKKATAASLFEEHGHVPAAAFDRTRVTFWEVIRAAEIHQYEVVLIENVVEASAWELFDVWLAGMRTLGYHAQFVSVSAAHVGGDSNPHAPQWRDRMYIVFTRAGIPLPDVSPSPLAWCPECDELAPARQQWKQPNGPRGRFIGKYRQQYRYACTRGHVVEPLVAPAAAALDLTNIGTRIGDRKRPLAAGTMRRIDYAVDMLNRGEFGPEMVFSVNHDGHGRAFDATRPSSLTDPLATFTGGGFHHGLVIKSHGGKLTESQAVRTTDDPLPTVRARSADFLVVPYRKGAKPHSVSRPLSTVATREQHGVMRTAVKVEDCYFRMTTPRESANAQRFPADYTILGNLGEQQMQSGNAVAVNVAHWLGRQVLEALDSRSAA